MEMRQMLRVKEIFLKCTKLVDDYSFLTFSEFLHLFEQGPQEYSSVRMFVTGLSSQYRDS
jgi:hypothetical protein